MKKIGAVAILSMLLVSGVFATEKEVSTPVCDIKYDDTSSQMFSVQKLCVDKTVIAVVYNEEGKPLGAANLNKPCTCVSVKEQGEPAYVVGRETKK